MQLLLMRHGEAEPYSTKDELRNLTPYGEVQSQKAGRWLKQQFEQMDFALVSPYVRAQQTLQVVQRELDIGQSRIYEDIVPSGNPALVHDYVDAFLLDNPSISSLLIVCHLPIVSFLADNFCQQQQSALFATSAILSIDYDVSKSCGQRGISYFPE